MTLEKLPITKTSRLAAGGKDERPPEFVIPSPYTLQAGQSAVFSAPVAPEVWTVSLQPPISGLAYIYIGKVTSPAADPPWVLGADVPSIRLPGAWIGNALTILAQNGPVTPVVVPHSLNVPYQVGR